MSKDSTRYPYTYAADLIRSIPEKTEIHGMKLGVVLSRSDASRIRQKIAEVLGIDDRELAEKLADEFLKKEQDILAELDKELKRGCNESPPES
jgi:hypothetical protein